jgi:GrpB-like predicted nucleotidyltransferase (UPF0157 family)
MVQTTEAEVHIVPYDPAWPSQFETEREKLLIALSPWLAGPIEHVGSTAVFGLAAKPVIDASRGAIDAIANLEYQYFPYRPDVMHWFCKPSPFFRTHHLHLIPYGGVLWKERIAFRDCLRSDHAVAKEYAELKRHLAKVHRLDREAYTESKGVFVTEVLRRVMKGAA